MSWQKNSVMSKELERRLSLVYNEPSNVNHKLERLRRVGGGGAWAREIQIQNHQSKSESKGVFLMKNTQAS